MLRLEWCLLRLLRSTVRVVLPVQPLLPFVLWRTYLANAALWSVFSVVVFAATHRNRHALDAPQIIAGVISGLILAALITALVAVTRRENRWHR